jgi:hypothetical protein
MDFHILGPLEVSGELVWHQATSGPWRVLLVHPNEPMSAECLAVTLCGEDGGAGQQADSRAAA